MTASHIFVLHKVKSKKWLALFFIEQKREVNALFTWLWSQHNRIKAARNLKLSMPTYSASSPGTAHEQQASLGGHFTDYWMHFKPRSVLTRVARARAQTRALLTPKSCSFDYCEHGRSVLRHRARARWNGGHRHSSCVLGHRNRLGQVIKRTPLSVDVFYTGAETRWCAANSWKKCSL